jgi:hypothetical protein
MVSWLGGFICEWRLGKCEEPRSTTLGRDIEAQKFMVDFALLRQSDKNFYDDPEINHVGQMHDFLPNLNCDNPMIKAVGAASSAPFAFRLRFFFIPTSATLPLMLGNRAL